MPDREKVIRAWEIFRDSNPYEICSGREFRAIREPEYCMGQMIEDTIAMLKEQEAKAGHWIVLEFCANEGIYCSECHMKIFDRTTKPKKKLSQYCPHCGSRNEQFFRDGEVVFR